MVSTSRRIQTRGADSATVEEDSAISLRDRIEDGVASNTEQAADSPAPAAGQDAGSEPTKGKPYRSWKKKYQKIRVAFDDKMELSEELHKQEVIALQTSKRLAVETECVPSLFALAAY